MFARLPCPASHPWPIESTTESLLLSYHALMESRGRSQRRNRQKLLKHFSSDLPGATLVSQQRSQAPEAVVHKFSDLHNMLSASRTKCSTCGDSGVLLHRFSDYSGSMLGSYHCSSCVLSSNRHMFCRLCLHVMKDGFPSSSSFQSGFVLCDECSSAKGRSSANRHDSQTSKMVISGKKSKAHKFSPSDEKCRGKIAGINQEAVAAARIVAAIAEKEACRLRKRAMDMSKAAADAVLRAQSALDTAYDLKREEDEKAGIFVTTDADENRKF